MALELTTAALIQAFLNDTSLSSTVLDTYAYAAEEAIALYCNRKDEKTGSAAHWLTAARTEYFRPDYYQTLTLRWTPVTAVASVKTVDSVASGVETLTALDLDSLTLDGLAITGSSLTGTAGLLGWRTSSAGLFASGYSFPPYDIGIGAARPRYPNFGRGLIKVAYTGGYATSAGVRALVLAATQLAATMYRNKSTDPTVKSETLGDFSQTFRDSATGRLPAEIASLCDPYVRMHAPGGV